MTSHYPCALQRSSAATRFRARFRVASLRDSVEAKKPRTRGLERKAGVRRAQTPGARVATDRPRATPRSARSRARLEPPERGSSDPPAPVSEHVVDRHGRHRRLVRLLEVRLAVLPDGRPERDPVRGAHLPHVPLDQAHHGRGRDPARVQVQLRQGEPDVRQVVPRSRGGRGVEDSARREDDVRRADCHRRARRVPGGAGGHGRGRDSDPGVSVQTDGFVDRGREDGADRERQEGPVLRGVGDAQLGGKDPSRRERTRDGVRAGA